MRDARKGDERAKLRFERAAWRLYGTVIGLVCEGLIAQPLAGRDVAAGGAP